jgi:peptidoglycan/LPS O-acetylase OafA/YrhL
MPPSTATTGASRRSRLDALDGLRGLAALGVVVLHVWMYTYGGAGKPPKGVLDLVIGELRLGVPLFFLLSGFLIYRPFVAAALGDAAKPDLRRYALRRAARIIPAYWVAVLAGYLLMRHLDHPMAVDAGALPIFLAFLQNNFEATTRHLDPPMWTMAIEASFYVVVPFVGAIALRLGAHRPRQVALALAVVAAGIAATVAAVFLPWPRTVTDTLPFHLADFGAGMTVAALVQARAVSRRAGIALIALGLALVVANSTWHALALGDRLPRQLAADHVGIAGFALVLTAVVAAPLRARLLTCAPVRWLGTISYGMYLIHYLVIIGLRETGHWPHTLGRSLLATLTVTVPLAIMSWFLIERPALRWVHRRTARGRAPRTAPATATPAREPRRQRTGELPALRAVPAER